jgi:hypothetical protein
VFYCAERSPCCCLGVQTASYLLNYTLRSMKTAVAADVGLPSSAGAQVEAAAASGDEGGLDNDDDGGAQQGMLVDGALHHIAGQVRWRDRSGLAARRPARDRPAP